MSLTNEECDALLAWDRGIHLEWLAVEEVSGRMWRRSQGQGPGSMVVRLETTFGISSTLDSLCNMENVADMMDHRSHIDDIRVVLEVDEDELPECALVDCDKAINRHLIRKGHYRTPEVSTTVEPV